MARNNQPKEETILLNVLNNAIHVSVSEAAKLGGVQSKTIRRAISSGLIEYSVVNDRYSIDLKSLIIFLTSSKKLNNKFNNNGLGQYVDKWNK